MSRKTDAEIKAGFGPELWAFIKSKISRRVSPAVRFVAPVTPEEPSHQDIKAPTIENITLNRPYLQTPFGGQGLGKQLPESQGISYGWHGRGGERFVSVRERFEGCRMLVSYFIRCGELVKIGQSNRVEARLSSLQVGNPQPLELLLCLPSRVGFREEDLHHRFRTQRKGGEWFAFEGDLARFIREKALLQTNPMDLSLSPSVEDRKLAGCGDV